MCRGLAARGHEVLLVAPIDTETERDGVRIIPTRLRGKVRRFLGAPGLVRVLADLEADIYHFHDPELLPWMVWLSRRGAGHRVVYDVHEYYPESAYTSNYFGWTPLSHLAGVVFGKVEPILARRLAGVVTVSPQIAERFEPGAPRVIVIRNLARTLSAPPARPNDLPSRQTLVLAGVLDESRLILEIVDAVAVLAPRWPDLHLLLIGDLLEDPLGNRIRQRARGRNIAERISFRPRMPWDLAQAYLAESVAGLVLLSDSENNRRALPNRLFEFMSLGVPVVATPQPLLRDVVTGARCGILLENGSVDTIAGAIDHLLRCPDDARAMGQRGVVATDTTYSWERELSRLEDFYNAV